MNTRKTLLAFVTLLVLWGSTVPAEAQYYRHHHRHHRRHCFYRHHRRYCR